MSFLKEYIAVQKRLTRSAWIISTIMITSTIGLCISIPLLSNEVASVHCYPNTTEVIIKEKGTIVIDKQEYDLAHDSIFFFKNLYEECVKNDCADLEEACINTIEKLQDSIIVLNKAYLILEETCQQDDCSELNELYNDCVKDKDLLLDKQKLLQKEILRLRATLQNTDNERTQTIPAFQGIVCFDRNSNLGLKNTFDDNVTLTLVRQSSSQFIFTFTALNKVKESITVSTKKSGRINFAIGKTKYALYLSYKGRMNKENYCFEAFISNLSEEK